MNDDTLILGAGMTGLATGVASGFPIIEAAQSPGGICLSYYMRPNTDELLTDCPEDNEVYRFENGGGHWIFGGDPVVLHFIQRFLPMERYARRSSVYFPEQKTYVPYPLQNHLSHLDDELAVKALNQMALPKRPCTTMQEWLNEYFGDELTELFFEPFHDLYTAGLHKTIAPQDGYKSPINLSLALQGAFKAAPAVGYNTTFIYPKGGLNLLARQMAKHCNIEYGQCVKSIDTKQKKISFTNGNTRSYDKLLSTLPLNYMIDMCNLSTQAKADPHTSVLVLNIGATKGEHCPDDHWLYVPHSESGFHRVGFYSNVADSFLPASSRATKDKVSIYIERAYLPGMKPQEDEIEAYSKQVVKELKQWGYIVEAEVVHPTWVDVAYTWSWPNSNWTHEAIKILQEQDIYQIGRYGRWIFQGIADSIRDGFIAGNSFKSLATK
jgi:protoporphyrinogen oxidase